MNPDLCAIMFVCTILVVTTILQRNTFVDSLVQGLDPLADLIPP